MNAAEYLISTFEHPKYGTVPKWVWNVSLTEITRAEIAGEFRGFKERDHYAGVMIVLWGNDPEDYLKEPSTALPVGAGGGQGPGAENLPVG